MLNNENDGIVNFFIGKNSFSENVGTTLEVHKWFVKSGDFVKKGDVILEVKVNFINKIFTAMAIETGIIEIINEDSRFINLDEQVIYRIHTDYDHRLI